MLDTWPPLGGGQYAAGRRSFNQIGLAAKISGDIVLPTIAGAAPLADFAEVVAVDDAALADAGIPFPADPAGSVTLAVAVAVDLLNGNSEDPREVFRDRLPAPMCPVIPERYGERECDDFGDVGYEDFDSRSGSSEYDDPHDYREWDDWSDTDNAEQPFPSRSDDSVLTSCASVLAVDEAVIATDSCSGDPRARSVLDGLEFRAIRIRTGCCVGHGFLPHWTRRLGRRE